MPITWVRVAVVRIRLPVWIVEDGCIEKPEKHFFRLFLPLVQVGATMLVDESAHVVREMLEGAQYKIGDFPAFLQLRF